MNQILYSGRAKKGHKALIIGVILVAVVIIALLFTFGFGIANLSNDKILKGVIVANVDVSNMTKEDAIKAINDSYRDSEDTTLSLIYKDYSIEINASEIGFNYTDAKELVDLAYAYGREGNIVENNFTILKSYFGTEKRIDTDIGIDNKLLEEVVNDMVEIDSMFAEDDSYEISGDKLIISKGTIGERIDFSTLSTNVLEALRQKQESVEISVNTTEPNTIDLDKLYAEIHKEPINASYKEGEDFELVSGENGVDFDLGEAKKLYSETERGESMTVQLVITEPEIKLEDLSDKLFENLISSYVSKYNTSIKNRVSNLQIATSKCNDVVLYPGDVFSLNDVLGKRTVENGYRVAESYDNGKAEQVVGEGVNQVSSALYNAILKADLKVEERTANKICVEYVEPSMDAIVNDSADLKFVNNRKYPIKIVATCQNGAITISIYGIQDKDEKTLEIETKILETVDYKTQNQNDSSLAKGTTKVIQKPFKGYTSEVYKVYYSEGKEVSRELISKDTYEPVDEIIKVGTKVVAQVVEPEPEPEPPAIEPLPEIIPPGWDNPESGYGR